MAVENYSDKDNIPLSEMIPLRCAPKLLPRKENGERYALKTVVRWSKKGIRGRKLRIRRIGRSLYTHPDWLTEFCEQSEEDATVRHASAGTARPPVPYDKWNDPRAVAEMKAAGFL